MLLCIWDIKLRRLLHSNMAHNQTWCIIIRSQNSSVFTMFFCFCLPYGYGTWLPLPEMAASNITVKLTPSGEFRKFSPFHCPSRSWFAAFAGWIWRMHCFFWTHLPGLTLKINLCAIARKWPLKRCHWYLKSKLNVKDLLWKIFPKSWPFLNWERLVGGKKILHKCALVLIQLECIWSLKNSRSYILLLLWEISDMCCHSITTFFPEAGFII